MLASLVGKPDETQAKPKDGEVRAEFDGESCSAPTESQHEPWRILLLSVFPRGKV